MVIKNDSIEGIQPSKKKQHAQPAEKVLTRFQIRDVLRVKENERKSELKVTQGT